MHCEYASQIKTNTELCNYVSCMINFLYWFFNGIGLDGWI